jgi:hypothetical protein
MFPITAFSLAAPIADAVTTTVTVSTASMIFPGQYILIDVTSTNWEFQTTSEWVQIQNIAGNVLTVLRGQAGTTARAHASGVTCRNYWIEMIRDIDRHPQMLTVMQDYFASLQAAGYTDFHLYNFGMDYAGQEKTWGAYRSLAEVNGYGDGRGGSVDNRLTLARPGQTHSKALNTNFLRATVNTRGQAFADWNAGVTGGGGGGGGTTYPKYVGRHQRWRFR